MTERDAVQKPYLRNTTILGTVIFVGACLCVVVLITLAVAFKFFHEQLFSSQMASSAIRYTVVAGFLCILLFNAASFAWVLHCIRLQGRLGTYNLVALLYSALCILLLLGEKTMINEMARETRMGWTPAGEQTVLFAFLAVQFIYVLLILGHLYRMRCSFNQYQTPVSALCDDTIFVAVHIIGIICGLTGLAINFGFMRRDPPDQEKSHFIVTYCVILIPYGIAVLYWLLMRIREQFGDWYDEKQLQDICKAGFVTLLLSIPGMAGLFVFSEPMSALWFPHYLFLILLLFSGTTLCLYKSPV